MAFRLGTGILLFAALAGSAPAQDEKKLTSGPPVGSVVPGTFNFFHMNPPPPVDMPEAKPTPRFRSLVLENQHRPVVLVFAKDPGKNEKDGVFDGFVKKLDELVHKHHDDDFTPLRGIIVYLSPAGKTSITGEKVEDPFQLVAEAEARNDLEKRIEGKMELLKRLTMGYTIATGPPNYKLNRQADFTILFYNNLKVIGNFAYTRPQFTEEEGDQLLARLEKMLFETEKK